jgi:hypothetical protein
MATFMDPILLVPALATYLHILRHARSRLMAILLPLPHDRPCRADPRHQDADGDAACGDAGTSTPVGPND